MRASKLLTRCDNTRYNPDTSELSHKTNIHFHVQQWFSALVGLQPAQELSNYECTKFSQIRITDSGCQLQLQLYIKILAYSSFDGLASRQHLLI